MSGVDVSREAKDDQVNVCASCVSTVVQSFTHFREQIERLELENAKLQMELDAAKQEQKEQKRIMKKKIKALQDKLVLSEP
ncbi:MAG: hypothetical protein NWF06_03250 [Candidatus Bathyarchaeota archaeon]|nr:hypothetical protein [Candidatus Bathyarchaeum sp.]